MKQFDYHFNLEHLRHVLYNTRKRKAIVFYDAFKFEMSFQIEMKICRKTQETQKFECTTCSLWIPNFDMFQKHIEDHEENYYEKIVFLTDRPTLQKRSACCQPDSIKVFSITVEMNNIGEEPMKFTCIECGSDFNDFKELDDHIKSHDINDHYGHSTLKRKEPSPIKIEPKIPKFSDRNFVEFSFPKDKENFRVTGQRTKQGPKQMESKFLTKSQNLVKSSNLPGNTGSVPKICQKLQKDPHQMEERFLESLDDILATFSGENNQKEDKSLKMVKSPSKNVVQIKKENPEGEVTFTINLNLRSC